MATERPRGRCEICRRWYRADPRVDGRQRACHRKECQRELHRRSCSRYNAQERIRNHVEQLSSKLTGARKAAPAPSPSIKYQASQRRHALQTGGGGSPATTLPLSSPDPPIPGMAWNEVELHFGLDHAVLLEVFARAIISLLQCQMTGKSQTGFAPAKEAPPRPIRGG